MCGICGQINLDDRPVREDALIGMRDVMFHRGPDDAGLFLDGPLGLGHRRLSIIDLAGGSQPMFNENERLVIIFNGEIYNFQPLRDGLKKKGHVFRTKSDTEVILHLYEEEGADCLKYFRGMFAFAIWDRDKKELFIARDRLGIKPLYYYCSNRIFIFASEIKALLRCEDVPASLNERGFLRYLRYRFVYGNQTLFKDIFELPPGHYLLVKGDAMTVRRYWNVPCSGGDHMRLVDAGTRVMETLEESVKMRMISDVPIGMFLSGGVDSSAITGLMARSSPKVKTFSIGFVPEELNELNYARSVADYFKTEHHEFLLEAEDFYSLLRKLIWHHDEPLMFPASIPLYILSKYSKDNATVMLAGEGADELFAGYENNVKAYWFHQLSGLFPLIVKRQLLNLPVSSRHRHLLKRSLLSEKELIRSYFQNLWSVPLEEICDWNKVSDEDDECLLGEIGLGERKGSFLERFLYFQLKTYLVALLMKQDKMSMAASIETRVPFLDHRFVEMVWQLRDNKKISGDEGKYVLKKACEGLLPREIIYRKKMGFPVPIEKWFREKGNPFLEVLTDASTGREGFFRSGFVAKELDYFSKGDNNSTIRLWTLLNVELWRREFLTHGK
jgi:asparagine synthase (glutamine-hydrolysing)